jgi:hypothetical protein
MMRAKGIDESYSPSNFVVVTAASCLASISAVFLYSSFVVGASQHHPERMPHNTDLLLVSLWCVVANFFAAFLALPFGQFLRRFLPSWLVVPPTGTLLFVFSFWLFAYWNAIRAYSPNDPFARPPPDVADIFWSASLAGIVLVVWATVLSYAAFSLYVQREVKTNLHLE